MLLRQKNRHYNHDKPSEKVITGNATEPHREAGWSGVARRPFRDVCRRARRHVSTGALTGVACSQTFVASLLTGRLRA
jgi:hypothetical protein